MGKEIADGLKNARFMGKLDSETYTKLKDISHEALLEQRRLHDENIQKSEKQLDRYEQRLKEILKDNEGIWFSTLGLKIWTGTILACVCWYHSFMPV